MYLWHLWTRINWSFGYDLCFWISNLSTAVVHLQSPDLHPSASIEHIAVETSSSTSSSPGCHLSMNAPTDWRVGHGFQPFPHARNIELKITKKILRADSLSEIVKYDKNSTWQTSRGFNHVKPANKHPEQANINDIFVQAWLEHFIEPMVSNSLMMPIYWKQLRNQHPD